MGPVEVQPWSRGQQATLWRVDSRGVPVAMLKVTPDRSMREAAAYQALADRLAPSILVPLDVWPGALLLPWSAGSPAGDDTNSHEAAGRFLARLETTMAPEDPVPPPAALQRRFETWWARGSAVLTLAQRRAMESALDLGAFEGWPRVWCHRDFEARNWLRDERGLVVLDWGQARADLRGWDRLKLRESVWQTRPELEEAFWRGYGQDPSPIAARELDQLALLHGLQTFVWGHTHGDPAFAELGRRILERRAPGVFPAP